jgi:hypothetical protein
VVADGMLKIDPKTITLDYTQGEAVVGYLKAS